MVRTKYGSHTVFVAVFAKELVERGTCGSGNPDPGLNSLPSLLLGAAVEGFRCSLTRFRAILDVFQELGLILKQILTIRTFQLW